MQRYVAVGQKSNLKESFDAFLSLDSRIYLLHKSGTYKKKKNNDQLSLEPEGAGLHRNMQGCNPQCICTATVTSDPEEELLRLPILKQFLPFQEKKSNKLNDGSA